MREGSLWEQLTWMSLEWVHTVDMAMKDRWSKIQSIKSILQEGQAQEVLQQLRAINPLGVLVRIPEDQLANQHITVDSMASSQAMAEYQGMVLSSIVHPPMLMDLCHFAQKTSIIFSTRYKEKMKMIATV